jgi:hypothetical protein
VPTPEIIAPSPPLPEASAGQSSEVIAPGPREVLKQKGLNPVQGPSATIDKKARRKILWCVYFANLRWSDGSLIGVYRGFF